MCQTFQESVAFSSAVGPKFEVCVARTPEKQKAWPNQQGPLSPLQEWTRVGVVRGCERGGRGQGARGKGHVKLRLPRAACA